MNFIIFFIKFMNISFSENFHSQKLFLFTFLFSKQKISLEKFWKEKKLYKMCPKKWTKKTSKRRQSQPASAWRGRPATAHGLLSAPRRASWPCLRLGQHPQPSARLGLTLFGPQACSAAWPGPSDWIRRSSAPIVRPKTRSARGGKP